MLKTLTLLCLLLTGLARPALAQSSPPPSDSVRRYLDHLFAPLDPAQVPTPYLEEYGFRFAPLRLFNGTLQDSNRTTATTWRLLYGSVLSGNINGPCTLPLLPDLNTTLQNQVAAGPAIPLLVQRIDYAALRPDAITAGLLTGQNDQLFDVPNRLDSPYLVKTVFAAAPARSTPLPCREPATRIAGWPALVAALRPARVPAPRSKRAMWATPAPALLP